MTQNTKFAGTSVVKTMPVPTWAKVRRKCKSHSWLTPSPLPHGILIRPVI